MHWDDDDGQPVSDGRTEPPSLSLARDTTLVARIVGESSPGSREHRVTILCASNSGALVTRLEDGTPLSSEGGPVDGASGAEPRLVPDDPGGQCRAMFDSWHLIEWFNCTDYTYDDGRLAGTAEHYGRFEAHVNLNVGFVTDVDVSVGTPDRRRLIEVQDWTLVENEPGLLRPDSLDLRSYFA